MTKKTKFQRFISLLCAIVCLSTSLAFPTSAASDINVITDICEADVKAWFPANSLGSDLSGNNYLTISKSCYMIELTEEDWYSLTLYENIYDARVEYGVSSHEWYALLFDIVYDESIKNLNFANYRLDVYFELFTDAQGQINSGGFTSDEYEDAFLSIQQSKFFGLDYADVTELGGTVPRLGHLNAYNESKLSSYNFYSNKNVYQKYSISDADDIAALFAEEYITFGFPFNTVYYGEELKFKLDLKLVYIGTGESDEPEQTLPPDIPDDPNTDVPENPSSSFGFASPESYDYDVNFRFSPTSNGQVKDGYEVTDFYLQNNSIRFKDTTDNIFTVSWPFDGYSMYYSFTYADGSSAADFSDTIFRTYTVDLESQLSTDLVYSGADISKYGFRTHFYIDCGVSSDFDFVQYKTYIEKAGSSFYGFEPFSMKVGTVVIPFEYWKLEFDSNNKCIRATLELDGQNEAHQSFIRALASNQQKVTVNFTLGNDTSFLFGTGTHSNGFWKKYSDSSVTPDNPETPNSGGFTQEDLDAAFNKGYNKGAADNGGTNYVFAFVNGLWSGFGQFYSLITNGISIGGISLNMIITSIIIIAVFVIVIKKVT